MKIRIILLAAFATLTATSIIAQVNFDGTTAYTENFDGLASASGSHTFVDNSTIAGVTVNSEEMDSNNDDYFTGTGSSTGGEVYSFGASPTSDRAIGYVGSGGNDYFNVFVSLLNTSGGTIDSLNISYDGELWRSGGTSNDNNNFLNFSYAIDAGSLPTSTSTFGWTEVDALDYSLTTNQKLFSTGARDGNGDSTSIVSTVDTLSWGANQTLFLRWTAGNAAGTDAGIALDNLSVSAVPEPSTYALLSGMFALASVMLRRRSVK